MWILTKAVDGGHYQQYVSTRATRDEAKHLADGLNREPVEWEDYDSSSSGDGFMVQREVLRPMLH